MKTKNIITLIILVLLFAVFLTSCGKKDDSKSGIANPASENCVKNGGKLTIVDEPAGQKGICTLPSGKECEEWAYFRGECK